MLTSTHLIATAAGIAIALGGGEHCRSITPPAPAATPPVTEADIIEIYFDNRLTKPVTIEYLPDLVDNALLPTACVPIHATWTMTWDDDVNGVVIGSKTCRIEMRTGNGAPAGVFDGPVFGQERDAVFSGDVIDVSGSKLIVMRQDEPGYACVYSGQVDVSGMIAGTWFDTRGGRGDFTMGDPEEPGHDPLRAE